VTKPQKRTEAALVTAFSREGVVFLHATNAEGLLRYRAAIPAPRASRAHPLPAARRSASKKALR
jgi:hypothetical protein